MPKVTVLSGVSVLFLGSACLCAHQAARRLHPVIRTWHSDVGIIKITPVVRIQSTSVNHLIN